MKKFRKKLLSIILATLLVFNSSIIVATAQPVLGAGGLGAILTLDFSGLALDYVERAILTTIGNVAEKQGDSDLGKVVSGAKKLLCSPLGNSLGNVAGMCEEMLEELDLINSKLDECNAKMDDLTLSQHYTTYQEYRSKLIAFKNTYNELYNMYSSFLTAMSEYEQDKTQEKYDQVEAAYNKIEAFYVNNPNVLNGDYTTLDFNFVNDLNDFLQLISSYLPSQPITAEAYPSDSEYWGNDQGTLTYIDTLYKCINDYYPYEHQQLEQMKLANSEVAGIASIYLTVHRMYVEVGAQMLAYDPSITEEGRSEQLQYLWDTYSTNAYKMVRGIEQLCSISSDYTKGFMTSLDTNTTIEVNSEDIFIYKKEFPNEYEFNAIADTKKITDEQLEFYQVKVPGLDYSYAILKGINANKWSDEEEFNNEDLVDLLHEEERLGITSPYYGISGDYIKLSTGSKSDIYRNYKYSMLSSAEELKGLISGANFDGYLYDYIKSQLAASDLPESSGKRSFDSSKLADGMLVPLFADVDDWDPQQAGVERNMDFAAVNISMPLDKSDLNRNAVYIDTKDDVVDDADNKTNPLIVLKSSEHKYGLDVNYNYGKGDVLVQNEDGTEARGLIPAGEPLVVKVRPFDGKSIKSLCLKRTTVDGTIIEGEEPYYLAGGSDEEETSLCSMMNMMQNEDGWYEFKFTAPYVQAVLCVEFADEEPIETYTVSLDAGENGVMMFADSMGLTQKEYKPGDVVTILVRPYEEYLLSKFSGTITPLYVTDETIAFAPNMEAYRFTMPSWDVDFECTFEKGSVASINMIDSGEGCSAYFYDPAWENCDTEWLDENVAFKAGDTVTIKVTETEQYYVKEVVITDYSSYDYIMGNYSDGTISFTMPNANVGIDIKYNKVAARSYTASLSKTGAGNLYFLDEDGEMINSTKNTFEEESVVTFAVVTEHIWDGKINIVDNDGKELQLTSLGDNKYSFIMPSSNVYISTEFAEEIVMSIEHIDGWTYPIYFVDENGKKIYSSSITCWEGDTITVECESALANTGLLINGLFATDAKGNDVPMTKVSDRKYTIVAGEEDILISADYDTYVDVILEGDLANDYIYFIGGSSHFPGVEIYFRWDGDVPEGLVLTATAENGENVEIITKDIGRYSLFLPDCNVYLKAEIYVNGVCTVCNSYEAPRLNASGYYEIENAGQLMWFNALVNNIRNDKVTFEEGNASANAILINDIDMSMIEEKWIPLGMGNGGFKGILDGKGHSVNNISLDYEQFSGLKEMIFAHLVDKGEIRDITIVSSNGEIIIGNHIAETGDNNNVWPWMAAIVVAGAGIVVATKKKKKVN